MTTVGEAPVMQQKIGRYDILTRLSVGGMAEIFLGVIGGRGGFRKFVTVKRILPSLQEEDEFVRMFLDEARITAALSHANIAQVFDLGEDGDDLFIAMEYIPGQDLRRTVKAAGKLGRPIPMGFSCAVMRDVSLALNHAHQFTEPSGAPYSVIHRDVSPKNVMVSYGGHVKVIDFGIAKAKSRLGHTLAGQVKGSVSYLSPEQVAGRELDGRSDIFAVGVILYELLTGVRPFMRDDDQRTMEAIATETPPAPQAVNPQIPAALSEAIQRAMARDPTERFETAKEMARTLEAVCPVPLFDEDERAAFMRDLFEDAIARTRMLLDRVQASGPGIEEAPHGLAATPSGVSILPPPPILEPAEGTEVTRASKPPIVPLVLVVDDMRTMRLVIERDLGRANFRVVTCASAAEAMAALERERPDAIILDVVMPDMDGFELCRRLREHPVSRNVPILFLSGACSLEERVQGLTVGADDFIRKPHEAAELAARIRLHLHRTSAGTATK